MKKANKCCILILFIDPIRHSLTIAVHKFDTLWDRPEDFMMISRSE